MKYIVCDGNRKLKYLTIFSSIEDVIEFLHSMYDFVYLKLKKLDSIHSQTICYNCNLCYKGYNNNIDLLIYGVREYVEKETI